VSGTGKSYQSLRLLASAVQVGIEVDVFDVHDELERIPGAVACRYSQATGYGYNPLELDTDPHTGGVNRQTEYLLGLVREASRNWGYVKKWCCVTYCWTLTQWQAFTPTTHSRGNVAALPKPNANN
jgi:hypothetical protein